MLPLESPAPTDGAAAVDWATVGWIIAAVIAVVAIVVTVAVTRRFGNRHAVLTWFAEATPLIPRIAEGSHLEVTYRDFPVPDPVLVTVVLVNSGPRDIASEMFDAGRPIKVSIAAPFYGVTRVEGGARLLTPAVGTQPAEATVEVIPLLLKRRQSWSISAVVSGTPTVALEAPLIDTDVRELAPRDWQGTIWSALAEVLAGMGSAMSEIASLVVPGRRR